MTKRISFVGGALTIALAAALVPQAVDPAPAEASPAIPDDLPMFQKVHENPKITVTTEDGTPVDENTVVHRGDTLLVHGTGFSPQANKGGFPFPIPAGVPNGVYALYSAFPDHWKPSENAPSENRDHPHSRMPWITPPGTLDKIPRVPYDMHRSVARMAQPMNANGEFTAKVPVNPPKDTPGGNWGIYVYPAAGSVNAAEEFYVPVKYSPEPGPNTPKDPTPDLVLDGNIPYTFTDLTKGGITPSQGAKKYDNRTLTFSRAEAEQGQQAVNGARNYEGLVNVTANLNMAEMAIKDPRIETRGNKQVLTAKVSSRYDFGPDIMHRTDIGTLGKKAANGTQPVMAGPINLGWVKVNG